MANSQERIVETPGQREKQDESRQEEDATEILKELDIWYRGEIIEPHERLINRLIKWINLSFKNWMGKKTKRRQRFHN